MTVQRQKEDLLIHYDESSGEIVFFTVASSKTGGLRDASFGGVRPTVEEMRAIPAKEALQRLGATVVGLLDLSSNSKIGITAEFDDLP